MPALWETSSLRYQICESLTLFILLRLSGQPALATLEKFWSAQDFDVDSHHHAWCLSPADSVAAAVRMCTWLDTRAGGLPWTALVQQRRALWLAWLRVSQTALGNVYVAAAWSVLTRRIRRGFSECGPEDILMFCEEHWDFESSLLPPPRPLTLSHTFSD